MIAAIDTPASDGNAFTTRFGETIGALGFAVEHLDWARLGARRVDLIVLHWPNLFFRRSGRRPMLARLARIAWMKARYGTKLAWVAHNLRPHERDGTTWRFIERLFLRSLDAIVFLSRSSVDAVEREFRPPARVHRFVTVHGRYDGTGATAPAAAAPGRLLFFGRVRPYKGVDALIDAARGVTSTPFALTLTGLCDAADRAALAVRADGDPRIDLDLRDALLSDTEIERAIDASRGVVLPYRDILNSGAAFHALSRRRPVLVPATGSLPELRDAVGGDWVHLYDGEIDAAAIDRFLRAIAAADLSDGPDLSAYSWDRVRSDLGRLVSEIAVGSRR